MNDRGREYEDQAAAYLKERGFKILDRNWSSPMGEIDIVAGKDGAVIFVEVRARSRSGYGSPADSVTPSKKAKIIKTAMAYIKARCPDAETFRFDFIGIVPGEAPEHVENAFSADGFGFF